MNPNSRVGNQFFGSRIAAATLMVTLLVWGPATGLVDAEEIVVDRFDDVVSGADVCNDSIANDCSLRGALIKANSTSEPDEIFLSPGSYLLTISGPGEDNAATGDLDILEEVKIVNVGKAGPVSIEQTTDDRLFHSMAGVTSFSIDGPMILLGGQAVGPPGLDSRGGQILSDGTEILELTDIELMGGHADSFGGCLHASAPASGGEISLSFVEGRQCTASFGAGAAIIPGGAVVTVQHSLFESNIASESGGALHLIAGTLPTNIKNSVLRNNLALSPAPNASVGGGGLATINAPVRLTHSAVYANRAFAQSEPVLALEVPIVAEALGGGVHASGTWIEVLNSTVSGNIVELEDAGGPGGTTEGSAFYLESTAATFRQSTVSGDELEPQVRAIRALLGSTVIFEGNVIEGGCAGAANAYTTQGFNVERPFSGAATTECGLTNPSDAMTTVPLLHVIAGNGGPTPTRALTDPPGGNPAKFRVPSSECFVVDQRHAPRGSLFCDAGAYESGSVPPGPWLFSDGFESGDTDAWDKAQL